MKSLNTITALNLFSTFLLNCITFITSPIFSRILGPGNYGIVSVYNVSVGVMVAVFGIQATSTYSVAKLQYDSEKLKSYESSMLGLTIISFFLFAFLSILAAGFFSDVLNIEKAVVYIMLFQCFGQLCINALSGKYFLEFRVGANLIISIITAVLNVVGSLLLVYRFSEEINYYGRILGLAGAYFLMGIVSAIILFRSGKSFFNWEYWKFCIPISAPMIFHALSGIVLNSSDKLMIQSMSNSEAVGIYGLALSFSMIMSMLWNSFNNTWVPFYCEYTRNNDSESISLRSKNYCELFSILTLGFILLSPDVFHLYASKEYWAGTKLIPILVLGFYFVFLYAFPVNYEFFHKKTKMIAVSTTAAAVFNVILNYVAIKTCGILGAAIATLIAHFLQFFLHYIASRRINTTQEYPFPFKSFLPWIIACMLCAGVISWIETGFIIIRWCLGFALGVFEFIRIMKRKALF